MSRWWNSFAFNFIACGEWLPAVYMALAREMTECTIWRRGFRSFLKRQLFWLNGDRIDGAMG